MWFKRKVLQGNKLGSKIGYPTLNFHVGSFGEHHSDGVYSCEVRITDKLYKGALYFGQRLSHKTKCLEIYVLDFSGRIYGQFVQLRVLKKIRPAKKFDNLDALKKQIRKDLLNLN